MLFKGNKVSEGGRFQKVAAESALEFNRTMRDPRTEVYACSVGFVAQNEAEQVEMTQLPPEYSDFADVASEDDSKELAAHSWNNLAINVAEGKVPPYQPLYSLLEAELVVLQKYLAEYIGQGWIRQLKLPAGAPILFAKKKDGSLRLCVDYRGLNKVTVKNRHPLPLIAESLERLAQAKIYTKLDIRDAYHRIRIKEGDK